MNIFEGARRIAKAFAAFCSIGALVAILLQEPHLVVSYDIPWVGGPPQAVAECADDLDDAVEYVDSRSSAGTKYTVKLCFKAGRADDGRMLVPFKMKNENIVLMDSRYSADVVSYKRMIAIGFQPSAEQQAKATELIASHRRGLILKGLGSLICALFLFWLFISVVGWIVRGFAGIPTGQDRRPT